MVNVSVKGQGDRPLVISAEYRHTCFSGVRSETLEKALRACSNAHGSWIGQLLLKHQRAEIDGLFVCFFAGVFFAVWNCDANWR